jgi:hypothetical protein
MKRQFDKRRIRTGKRWLMTSMNDRDFRPWRAPSAGRKSPIKKIGAAVKRILGLRRKLEPWELELKALAEQKRARRRERNIRWWSNDRTWRATWTV